jgi:hypothetical protein
VQVVVGRRGGRDARPPEIVDDAVLPGAVHALAAAPGLRRVRADVLGSQAGQGAADGGEAGAIDGAAGVGRVKGPARTVGVERSGEAPCLQDLAQRRRHGDGGLGGSQLGVQQGLGGVVEDRDHDLPLVGAQCRPGVRTAGEGQQFAEAGARLTPQAVAAPDRRLATSPASCRASSTKLQDIRAA